MVAIEPITFVIPVSNRELYQRNFLASPCLVQPHPHEILVQEGFSSASKAYNDAIDRASNDLIVFCHQDILLPGGWFAQLQEALGHLQIEDPHWGVLGSYGETQDGRGCGHVYSSGRDVIGTPLERPVPVQTLDELLLILRRSSGLRFDDALPHFHFYGADICLRAAARGMRSYAVSAFCIHNAQQVLVLPAEFYEACRHVKNTWREYLPIQTTCIRITRFDVALHSRRLREFYLKYVRRRELGRSRVEDPLKLLQEIKERG
jgi:glycosyltransferase involved in cell wall biosynthesis